MTGFKLFTIIVVDSLYLSVLVAYAFIRSESFVNLNFIAEALGITMEKITVISDDNEAMRLLARTYGWLHLLCQWHYAAAYIRNQRRFGVRHADCNSFNNAFFRLLQSTDFESAEAFGHELNLFIDAFKQQYPAMGNWLQEFAKDAEMVCEYFRAGVYTAGAHTSQRNESIHSLIKCGNLMANALREMSFFASYVYLTDIVEQMLETSLDELSRLLQKNLSCCPHVSKLIRAAAQSCTEVCIGDNGWTLRAATEVEVRAHVQLPQQNYDGASFHCVTSAHASTAGAGSPAFEVTHWVALKAEAEHAVFCSCHEFSTTGVSCVGIAAAIKQRKGNPEHACWLNQQWQLSFHPLFPKAVARNCPSSQTARDGIEEASSDPPDADGNWCADTADDRAAARWRNIQAIPVPTTNTLRRSVLNDAWNALRDDFHVHTDVAKYRAIMASFNDLRANFSGSPGCWLQAPTRGGDCQARAWTTAGVTSAPPPNQANNNKRQRPQSQMSVADYNKAYKHGQLPTVEDRRAASGDWSLYLPTNKSKDAKWICPVPECMLKPISNTDQARHAHRGTKRHGEMLLKYPTNPNADRTPAAAPGASNAEDAAEQGAPDTSAPPGISGVAPTSAPPSETGTCHDGAGIPGVERAPAGTSLDGAGIPGEAAAPAGTSLDGAGMPGEEAATASFLPPHPDFPHFPINQFCEECTHSVLCSHHAAMVGHQAAAPSGIPGNAAEQQAAMVVVRAGTRPHPRDFMTDGDSMPALPSPEDSQGTRVAKSVARIKCAIERRDRAHPPPMPAVALPPMAGLFPRDVQYDRIRFEAWADCGVRVGKDKGACYCHVWNATYWTGYDAIAVEVLDMGIGTGSRLSINNTTIECTEGIREVTCVQVGKMKRGQQRQRIVFFDVCDSFHAWAMDKLPRNYTDFHFASFKDRQHVVVECGGDGDCFYHACLFLLNTFAPNVCIDGCSISSFDHKRLREATVGHLRSRYRDIDVRSRGHEDEFTVSVFTLMDFGYDGDEDAVVEAYCAKHIKLKVKAEEPCVYALAHLLNMSITVYQISRREPVLASAAEQAITLELWCNDVHYQAVADTRRLVISANGLASRGYREANWVYARDVTSLHVEEVD